MLKAVVLSAVVLAAAITTVLAPGIASAKDCTAYCQKVRCKAQNVGGGSVGSCMAKCVSACNNK